MADRDVLINLIVNGKNNVSGALNSANRDLKELRNQYNETNKAAQKYQDTNKDAIKLANDFGNSLEKQNQKIQKNRASFNSYADDAIKRINSLKDRVKNLHGESNSFIKDLDNLSKSFKQSKNETDDFAKAVDSVNKRLIEEKNLAADVKRAMFDLGKGNQYVTSTIKEQNKEMEKMAVHYNMTSKEVKELIAEEQKLIQQRRRQEAADKNDFSKLSGSVGRGFTPLEKRDVNNFDLLLDKVTNVKNEIKETTVELNLFKKAINKLSGGRANEDDKNDQFRNLRGLTSELRGFGIAFAIKNVQGLASAGVGAASGLTALASSAISAGGALGGALAAGAAQAVGPLGVLAATIGRITSITKVLNLKQQIQEASVGTAQADAVGGASDAVISAQERLADSLRGSTKAQKDYNDAVREAKRNLQDMRLEQARANLNLEDAQRNLAAASLGGDTASIASARLDLREARLKAQRTSRDNRAAQRGGVREDPGVIAAKERMADADRQAAQATRALAQAQKSLAAAGDGATASQDRLTYMLSQLTSNEKRLVKSIEGLQDAYKKAFRGVSDIIIGEIANTVDVMTKMFGRTDIIEVFMNNAKAGAASMKQITSFLSSENTIEFFKIFTEQSTENIPKFTDGLINIGKALMNIATNSSGIFNVILEDLVKLTERMADATANSEDFFSNALGNYEAWRGLLGAIWDLFKVIFEPASLAGMGMIVGWTKEIDKFVDKLKANPQALAQFFEEGVFVSNQILRVIWEIGKALHDVFRPSSVKSLADFLIMIFIPALEQTVKTVGIVTHIVQEFLAIPIVATLAKSLLTITLVTRAFEIMATAVKSIGLALALTFSPLSGGKGLSGTLRAIVSLAIILAAVLGSLGIDLNEITKFFKEHAMAVTIATSALGGFMALLAVNKIAAYITAVGGLTKAFHALAASEALAGVGGMFIGGRIKGGPNMSGANLAGPAIAAPGIMGRIKNMSKTAKGLGVGGLAAGVGAGAAGSVVGGKTGSFISNIGAGAGTGAAVGSLAGPWGAAAGAVVGGLAGLGSAYLTTKKKQESFAESTRNATDALRKQKDAIDAVADARLDKKEDKLDLQQARIDFRRARSGVKTTFNQLKAEGLTDKEIKNDDRYKQALIDRRRALIALQRAEENYAQSSQKIKDAKKVSEKEIRLENQKILKAIDAANRELNDAQDKYSGAKSRTKRMGNLYGKDSAEYRRSVEKEREALERLNKANRNYRSSLNKVPGAYANVTAAGKTLNKSFKGSKKEFEKLIASLVGGTNGVLKGFGADELKFKVQSGFTTVTGGGGDEDAATVVLPKASGGWIGKAGQRGRDTVKTVLGRGEAVLNHAQQRVVNGALVNSGIGGLDEVFQRTKGSYHYMAGGGFAGMAPGITRAAQSVLSKFPGLMLSSGRRNNGGTSYHESGLAADISGSPGLMYKAAQWIKTSSLAKRLSEGIHNPNLSIKNGKTVSPGFWGGKTWAGHMDHIHIALGGALGKITGGMASEIKKLKMPKIGGSGPLKKMLQGAGKNMVKAANRYIAKKAAVTMSDADLGAPSGSGKAAPPGKVRSWLKEALQITGHYTRSNLNSLFGRAMQESGGNPKAINLWDSNAKAGTPSKGLLQTIDSTFNAYKIKGMGNIWNPVHNAVAAIRYMFSRYGHIVGSSSSGYAKGGVLPGPDGAPQNILAHGGEWILNKGQQVKAAALAGLSPDRLRSALGFSGGNGSFAGGGVVDQSSFGTNFTNSTFDLSGAKNRKFNFNKFQKALRNITADNGYIAQFLTSLENFSTKLSNRLKVLTYGVKGGPKKLLSELEIIQKQLENITAEAEQLGKLQKKIRTSRRRAQKSRNQLAARRNNEDDELSELYDTLDSRREQGLTTKSVENAIKRREKALKKKDPRRLKRFKRSQSRLRRARKGVLALRETEEELAARRAELAQEAYEASISAIDLGANASSDRSAQRLSDVDFVSRQSVGNAASMALAGVKNSGLATRNSEIASLIAQYTVADPWYVDMDVQKKIQDLRNEMRENTLQMKANTIAAISNTAEMQRSFASFKTGVVSSGINVIKSLGALSGSTNNTLIGQLLTGNAGTLTTSRTQGINSLNTFLAQMGQSGISSGLSGEDLITKLVSLSNTITTGWTEDQQSAFRELVNSLIENESAIVDNTQQLKDLNGNNDQGFSSYSWTAFRKAVFDGTGGLMPNLQDLVPHAAVGADVVGDGLAYVHAAEVILNKNDAKEYKNGRGEGDFHLHIDTPLEVADPIALSNKFMYELKHRGK